MKSNSLFKMAFAVLVLIVSACSGPRLAQQNSVSDDVYVTKVETKTYVPRQQNEQYDNQQTYTDANGYNDSDYVEEEDYYEYGLGYANRFNNFYRGNSWRPYYNHFGIYGNSYMPWYSPLSAYRWNNNFYGLYDPWYDNSFGFGIYDRFGPFGYRYGFGYGLGFGYRFGSPYYFGGGYSNGGYYGGGWIGNRPTVNPNYNPRPSRGAENRPYINPNNGIVNGRPGDRNSNTRPSTMNPPGRNAERPNPSTTTRPGSTTARPNPASSTRPPRESSIPTRVQERPSSFPPSNSGGGRSQSSGGGSSSGGGGGSSSGRPTRGGN